jgi:hypothetical protein
MHPSSSDSSAAAAQGPWRGAIFLGMDSGVAIRNIIRTDVFAVLKAQPWLRIVIFGPLVDDEFLREVAAPNVLVEKLPQKKEGPILALLASIKKEIWADKAQLFTFGSKRLRKRGRGIRDFFIRTLCRIDSADRIRATLAKIRNLEKRFAPAHAAAFFDRYQPDLLFTTTLYSRVHNLEWLAKQRGIPCAAFVLSWDNPTSKGPFPVRPERVILWNEILRQELITYHHGKRDASSPPKPSQHWAKRSGYGQAMPKNSERNKANEANCIYQTKVIKSIITNAEQQIISNSAITQ